MTGALHHIRSLTGALLLVLWLIAPVQAAPRPPGGRHALYLEALGKGGLWGLGYDYQLHRRLCLGAVVSYAVLRGDHLATAAPYVGTNLLGAQRHRWFAHLGPVLTHVRTPSPVPEWAGRSALGVAGALSSGYEFRGRVLVRAFATGTVGRGGFAPWAGLSLGWAP